MVYSNVQHTGFPMYITLEKSKKTLPVSNVMCTGSRCDSHYNFQSDINVIHMGTRCISHRIFV